VNCLWRTADLPSLFGVLFGLSHRGLMRLSGRACCRYILKTSAPPYAKSYPLMVLIVIIDERGALDECYNPSS
jgi:hypothetical protein